MEKIICVPCQVIFGAKEIEPGLRKLGTFKGYTVDFRLKQFRKIPHTKLPEFIDFTSAEGEELVAQMHEAAIKLTNKLMRRLRKKLRRS